MTRRAIPADELLADFQKKYPAPVAELLHHLWQQVAYVHLEWGVLGKLFGTKEHAELLVYSAPHTFGIMQECLRRSVLLSIARLTDPSRQAGRQNATLERLPEVIRDAGNTELARELATVVRELVSAVQPIRRRRNKLLAHSDLALALRGEPRPLPSVKKEMIDEALATMRVLINRVEMHYQQTSTIFEVIGLSSDIDGLLYSLAEARRAEEEERAQALGPRPQVGTTKADPP